MIYHIDYIIVQPGGHNNIYKLLKCDMNTLRNGRIIGLPIQFVTVTIISIIGFIYISGWAAYSNVESRAQSYSHSYKGDPSRLKLSNNIDSDWPSEIEKYNWEKAALLVCPLH